ncbi:PaaI family thioesterase [Vannielia litorea]|uniref:PaaI family thioesterase n=1 Tax=Vannielia litorea TaxID=1217970 RepID=UPI001BD155F5|nr:PaaI family thioesterase [Vannielia litorea]MBS8225653.1 PaaI family thioesterase [Vannielia litorea]
MTEHAETPAPPKGFTALTLLCSVDESMGPWFLRENDDGSRTVGFRVEDRHLNVNGVCHGGVTATFADILARVFNETYSGAAGTAPVVGKMATITLDIDYLGPGQPGAWIEATPEVVKRTGKMLFTQALICDGETPVARCKAIYRLFHKKGGTD